MKSLLRGNSSGRCHTGNQFLKMYILARLPFGFGTDHQAHIHWLGVEDYTTWENMIPLSTGALLALQSVHSERASRKAILEKVGDAGLPFTILCGRYGQN